MKSYGSFNIFAESDLRNYLDSRFASLRGKIASESENYILNVDEDQYLQHLVSLYKVEDLVLEFGRVEASSREVQVPAEQFSPLFYVQPGKSYPKTAIVFHIPFTGDSQLFRSAPSSFLHWTYPVWIEGQELCFEVIDMSNDPDDINHSADGILRDIGQQAASVKNEVQQYNSNLEAHARQIFRSRKEQIRTKHGFLAAIKVPLRNREGLPETFSVPAPKTPRRIEARPAASEKVFQPEPTVDEGAYREILKIIYDLGKVFERLPSTYAGKSEEDLRDHVLLYLEPRFAGSATGETFNKGGKTDILLRYENTNVFVAEFKFWKGPQSLVNAATQLFSYLTWRDSKVALVIFVRNKGFGEVLEAARIALRNMDNFVRENPPTAESWFDFVFSLPGDPSRMFHLALLLFHLPVGGDGQ